MLKVSFWVEVVTQQTGYTAFVKAATAPEMVNNIPSFIYEGNNIDPYSYCLEKDGEIVCEGTYKDILEKLKSIEE